MSDPFKKCPCCNTSWLSRSEFLEDGSLEMNGYAPDFDNLLEGLFFFTHHASGCYSTMTLRAKTFADLYTGKRYVERKTGGDECPQYCFNKGEMRRCEELCECAYVREIIDVVRQHPKVEPVKAAIANMQ